MPNLSKTLVTPCFGVVLAGRLTAARCRSCGRGQRVVVCGGQSAEHPLPGDRAHAQRGERGRAPSEVAGHDSKRRLGHACRRRGHGLRARLGRQPVRGRPADRCGQVDGEHPRRERCLPRQSPCHSRSDGRQGNRRHAGRHPLRGRAGCEDSRLQQVHRCSRLEHAGRVPLRRDHHTGSDRVRRQGLRRRRIPGGGAGSIRARLHVVVPRQHARPRPQFRSDPLEDVHGPSGPCRLHGQRRLGQLAGDRYQARSGLHRHREQLFGAPVSPRLREGGRG